ncbi:hypothetical protein DB346_12070 [Verrucomicrobia bacterium LW23]|nr:hypothetical protein DB346_12070 [Verrucomicrobia bacterium LW23]
MTSQGNPDAFARMTYVAHLEAVPRLASVLRVSAEAYGHSADARYLQPYFETRMLLDNSLYARDIMDAGSRFGGPMDAELRGDVDRLLKELGGVIPAVTAPMPQEEGTGADAANPPVDATTTPPPAPARPDWEALRGLEKQVAEKAILLGSIVRRQVEIAQQAEELGSSYYVRYMWVAVGFVGVFTLFIQQIITRSIVSPLTDLGETVRRLKAGEYTVRAPLHSSDEIGMLASAFNAMADSIEENQRVLEVANRQLSRQQDELQNINQELEKRVEEKTDELKKTLATAESDATKLQTIINRMPDGLVLLGERSRILSANAAALHILGHREAASVQDWIDTKPGAFGFRQMNHVSVGRDEMPFARASRGDSFSNVSLYLRGTDNQSRLVSFSGGPILFDTAGQVTLSVCIFRDVSLELALRQELEEKNIKLAEAARLKDEFLATLSHELRTPLTPVVSHAHLLLSDSGLSEDDMHSVRVIERNARALSRMIDELLDLSGVMNRKLRLLREPTKIRTWVEHTLDTIRPACAKKGQTLHFHSGDEEVTLNIDPARLTQVLVNLVTNAVKYTDEGGRIDVTLAVEPADVLVHVRDNGIGLSRHDMREIFAMFHQTRASMTRRAGGLGIGLSVAKSLAELHGGDISVHSDGPGKGSVFTLRLPREAPMAAAEEPTKQPGAQSAEAEVVAVQRNGATHESSELEDAAPGLHSVATSGASHDSMGVHLPEGDRDRGDGADVAPAGAASSPTELLPLPAGAPVPATEAAASAASAPPVAAVMDRRLLRGRRILIVEDSEDTLEALSRILRRRECVVFTAGDGRAGLELARREHPDIILSDIGLPVMDGLEMARRIRADSSMARVIMVASSGLGRAQDIEAAIQAGFAAHVLKPVDIAALDKLLLRLLDSGATPEADAARAGTSANLSA